VVYRVFMSIAIDAGSDIEAQKSAVKITELLKSPFVKMAAEGENVRLAGDGRPVISHLKKEGA
jgi:hypothetical protein